MGPDWIDARCSRVPGGAGLMAASAPATEWKRRLDSELTARIAELDCCGIQRQVLYAPLVLTSDDPRADSAAIGAVNDALAQVVSSAGGRLESFAHIDFDDGTQGVRSLETAMERGFCGAAIRTRHREYRLDELFFRAFLAHADRDQFPVLILSAGLHGGGPSIDARQQSHVGVHGDLGICLARMIFTGVFEELPRLALYPVDGGGILPGLIARLDHGYEVRKECRALLPRPPSTYLRNVYVDGVALDEATLECTMRLMGSAQIVFASDATDCAVERRRIEGVLARANALAVSRVSPTFDENARRLFRFGGRNAH